MKYDYAFVFIELTANNEKLKSLLRMWAGPVIKDRTVKY